MFFLKSKKYYLFLFFNSLLFLGVIVFCLFKLFILGVSDVQERTNFYIILGFSIVGLVFFLIFFFFIIFEIKKIKKKDTSKNFLTQYFLQKISEVNKDLIIFFDNKLRTIWLNNPTQLKKLFNLKDAQVFFSFNFKKIFSHDQIEQIKKGELEDFMTLIGKEEKKELFLVHQIKQNAILLRPLAHQNKWRDFFFKEKPVFLLLQVDQLSQFVHQPSFDRNKTEILAHIIVEFNEFFKEKKDLILELSKGEFLVITNCEKFRLLKKNDFKSFLQKIKRSVLNRFRTELTLSGGAFFNDEASDLFESLEEQKADFNLWLSQALKAKKMAQSRGGDQIIILNQREDVKIVGSQKISIQTMPKIHQKYNEFIDTIKKYNKIFIICHKNPDFDAISSALALKRLLLRLFPKIYCQFITNSLSEDVKKDLKILTGSENYLNYIKQNFLLPKKPGKKEILIFLDTNNTQFIDFDKESINSYDKAVFDHHLDTFTLKKIRFKFINSWFGATSEMISFFIEMAQKQLGNFKCESWFFKLLLVGILLDTYNLQSNVGKFTLGSVFFLQNQGVDINQTILQLNDIRAEQEKIIEKFIHKADKTIIGDKVVLFKLIDKDVNQTRTAIFTEKTLKAEKVKMVISIMAKRQKEKIFVSVRSKDKKFNSFVVGYAVGGGGDNLRAGSQIVNENIKDVFEKIKKVVETEILSIKK